MTGNEAKDGEQKGNINSSNRLSNTSINHKAETAEVTKGDILQINDKKSINSNLNNDKNKLDNSDNEKVDKLPDTGESENQDNGLLSSLIAMIGAFLLIGRRRKDKENHQ